MAKPGLKTEARNLGLTVMRLKKFIEALKEDGERVSIPLSEEQRRKILDMAAEEEKFDGMITLGELREMFNTSKSQIYQVFEKHGIAGKRLYSRKLNRYVAAYERDKVVPLLRSRYELPDPGYISLTAAAKRIGKNRRELLYWFNSQGIEPREVVLNMKRDYYVRVEDWKKYFESESSSYLPAYLVAELLGVTRTVIELIAKKYGGDFEYRKDGTLYVVMDSVRPFVEALPKRDRKTLPDFGPMPDDEVELVLERSRLLVGEELEELMYREHVHWRASHGYTPIMRGVR